MIVREAAMLRPAAGVPEQPLVCTDRRQAGALVIVAAGFAAMGAAALLRLKQLQSD